MIEKFAPPSVTIRRYPASPICDVVVVVRGQEMILRCPTYFQAVTRVSPPMKPAGWRNVPTPNSLPPRVAMTAVLTGRQAALFRLVYYFRDGAFG